MLWLLFLQKQEQTQWGGWVGFHFLGKKHTFLFKLVNYSVMLVAYKYYKNDLQGSPSFAFVYKYKTPKNSTLVFL